MPSLRNALLKTVGDLIEDGRTIFYLEDILRWTFPEVPIGPGFLNDGLDKLISVMRATQFSQGVPLIPLSDYFFSHYRENLPETEKDARKCIPGTMPRTGPAVGFKVAEKDVLTKVWRKYGSKAAIGHVEGEWRKAELVCGLLGIEAPKRQLRKQVQRITGPKD